MTPTKYIMDTHNSLNEDDEQNLLFERTDKLVSDELLYGSAISRNKSACLKGIDIKTVSAFCDITYQMS